MQVLTGEQMRRVDRCAIDEMGIPGLLLMESAGQGVVSRLERDYAAALAQVLVVCGKGNNGGDGLVVARHLRRLGVEASVVLLGRGDGLRGDAAINLRAATASGVPITEIENEVAWTDVRGQLSRASLIVDAILGTGVRGGARGLAATAIREINDADTPTVAVDLPSGLDADSAQVEGAAVLADRTYTLCRPKPALVLDPAASFAGRWTVVPIGIPNRLVDDEPVRLEWLDPSTAAALLPARQTDSHKGTWGHLLAVAGSRGKSGAAVLVGRGALRSGVGLATVATASSSQDRVAVQQAELMTEALAETADGSIAAVAVGPVRELLSHRDALALGPGLGTGPETQAAVVSLVAGCPAPVVLDADGLNAFGAGGAAKLSDLQAGSAPLVLTPHPGEAARLLGSTSSEVQRDRLAAVSRLARETGAVVVLKGHRTLISRPDGAISVNSSGNPGLATAGTGDVLTGMIGAHLSRGASGWDAARLAVFVHGRAGDLAAREMGQEGMTASDVLQEIPRATSSLQESQEPDRW